MIRRILRRLIWVYTVCSGLSAIFTYGKYGTPLLQALYQAILMSSYKTVLRCIFVEKYENTFIWITPT